MGDPVTLFIIAEHKKQQAWGIQAWAQKQGHRLRFIFHTGEAKASLAKKGAHHYSIYYVGGNKIN